MIVYKTGDLFTAKTDALAHGCNAKGLMGAGIAKDFKEKFLNNYLGYSVYCQKNTICGGEIYFNQRKENDFFIFNLITQVNIGKNAKYMYILECFNHMKYLAHCKGIESVAMPQIGCGIGGLKWVIVNELLKDVFTDEKILIEVYSR